jgi:hypothetical protein
MCLVTDARESPFRNSLFTFITNFCVSPKRFVWSDWLCCALVVNLPASGEGIRLQMTARGCLGLFMQDDAARGSRLPLMTYIGFAIDTSGLTGKDPSSVISTVNPKSQPSQSNIRSSSYMQASRSLFQTGIKLKGQPAATGIAKSRPFLNIWGDKDQISTSPRPSHQQHRTMASATSFFDFTPKDSTSHQFLSLPRCSSTNLAAPPPQRKVQPTRSRNTPAK